MMRPGMPRLAQRPGQEHERSEQQPDTTGHALRHRASSSIGAPRLSITAPPGRRSPGGRV
jgi:hypothetical protein